MTEEMTPSQNFLAASTSAVHEGSPESGVISPTPTVELGYNPSDYEAPPVEVATQPVVQQETPKELNQSDYAHKLAQMAKTERKLQLKQKEAEALIKQAESVREAFNSSDMIEALEKLGLKPNELYRKLTDHVLKDDKPAEPIDPLRAELDATKKELSSYAEAQKKMMSEITTEREQNAHAKAMNDYVRPVIKANIDKYETAINVFKGVENFENAVYAEMYNSYTQSGESYTAAEVADAIETHWSEQMSLAIENAKSLKKYNNYFAKETPKEVKDTNIQSLSKAERLLDVLSAHKKDYPEEANEETITESPKTLTNNMNNYTPSNESRFSPFTDRKAQIAAFMKNYK